MNGEIGAGHDCAAHEVYMAMLNTEPDGWFATVYICPICANEHVVWRRDGSYSLTESEAAQVAAALDDIYTTKTPEHERRPLPAASRHRRKDYQ